MPTSDADGRRQVCSLLEQDRRWLLLRHPFLAHIALALDIVPVRDDRCPTACVDGRSVFADINWMLQLPEDHRRSVLAHEIWHVALGHLTRRLDRDAARWNQAVDHEVNLLLVGDGFVLPDRAVYDAKWRGRAAEYIYGRLDNPGPRPHDADGHLWDMLDRPRMRQWDPAFQPRSVDDKQAATLRRRVMAAALAAGRTGMGGHGASAWVQRLLARGDPVLPWPAVLRDFIERQRGTDRQWTTPSRRHLARGLYLPGRGSANSLEITVVIDTSGSCVHMLPAFMAELQAIADTAVETSIRVLSHDNEVHDHGCFGPFRPLPRDGLMIPTGGGTSFTPVLKHLAGLSEAPRAVVWLTDGDASDKEDALLDQVPPYPVLWALTHDGVRVRAWGGELRFPPRPGRL